MDVLLLEHNAQSPPDAFNRAFGNAHTTALRLSAPADGSPIVLFCSQPLNVLNHVERAEFGKPFLPDTPGLHFNLSHASPQHTALHYGAEADGRWALAVSARPVGIDVERLSRIKQINSKVTFINRFFTADETAYLLNLQASERDSEILEFWTRKEAYIKLDGRGLSVGLNTFSVLNPPENIVFTRVSFDGEFLCTTAHLRLT
jgi:4'-phosphopantetheinyl transferase